MSRDDPIRSVSFWLESGLYSRIENKNEETRPRSDAVDYSERWCDRWDSFSGI